MYTSGSRGDQLFDELIEPEEEFGETEPGDGPDDLEGAWSGEEQWLGEDESDGGYGPDFVGPRLPCALVAFRGKRFSGKTPVVDWEFLPHLERIHDYADRRGVTVYITSSFRVHGAAVGNTVVPPATRSNHLAGHAIDMNLVYRGQWYNSKKLRRANLPALPAAVRGFLEDIRSDANLRWGGDFRREDPVHIDDHLNRDRAAWEARFQETQRARQSGCG